MFQFKISTGVMTQNGTFVGDGYSGDPQHTDMPSAEDLKNEGPLPEGYYEIQLITGSDGIACDYEHKKAPVMRLIPDPDNEMYGRGGFLIHGDLIGNPGAGSHGCIVMPHGAREFIANSGDNRLQVIA